MVLFPYGVINEFDFICTQKFQLPIYINWRLLNRRIGFWVQKIKYGFSPDETWDLGYVFAEWFLPRFQFFRRQHSSYRWESFEGDTREQSRKIYNDLKEIEWWLKQIPNEINNPNFSDNEKFERMKKAGKKFAKMICGLWL